LGLLNCIRIWHDNTGQGSSSSWFLKYLIIRDLQTMEKFHFISQRWFGVEKDDGKVNYNLYRSFLFLVNRLNVFYPLQVILKKLNFLLYYPKVHIILYPMVIYGSQSFHYHYQINLHVFNDVLFVLFYFLFQCF
jgi:hypothetical protein